MMLEDIVVLRRELGSESELCSLCGVPYPGPMLRPRESDAGAGIRSAHADVCPECDHLLDRGEEPACTLVLGEEVTCALG